MGAELVILQKDFITSKLYIIFYILFCILSFTIFKIFYSKTSVSNLIPNFYHFPSQVSLMAWREGDQAFQSEWNCPVLELRAPHKVNPQYWTNLQCLKREGQDSLPHFPSPPLVPWRQGIVHASGTMPPPSLFKSFYSTDAM